MSRILALDNSGEFDTRYFIGSNHFRVDTFLINRDSDRYSRVRYGLGEDGRFRREPQNSDSPTIEEEVEAILKKLPFTPFKTYE